VEYITTYQVQLKVDTPSRYWDGDMKTVWITGYVLTLGEQVGDLMDSSRLNKEIVELTALSMHALLISLVLLSDYNKHINI